MSESDSAPGQTQVFAERYKVVRPIGKGAMGEVFETFDQTLGIKVAFKILHKKLARDPAQRERFLREARVTRKLMHQNIVRTFDVGEIEGVPFFTMELLTRSVTVADLIKKQGPLPIDEVIGLSDILLRALDEIHRQNIIHRDIKPSNILFTAGSSSRVSALRGVEHKYGVVKVADFGVAHDYEDPLGQLPEVAGSGSYMAPEIWREAEPTFSSDLYSLGATLYEALSGNPPFLAESAYELMVKHFDEPIPDVRTVVPRIPQWYADFLKRLLGKHPRDRFASAAAALSHLVTAMVEHDAAIQQAQSLDASEAFDVFAPDPQAQLQPDSLPVPVVQSPATPEQVMVGVPPAPIPELRQRTLAEKLALPVTITCASTLAALGTLNFPPVIREIAGFSPLKLTLLLSGILLLWSVVIGTWSRRLVGIVRSFLVAALLLAFLVPAHLLFEVARAPGSSAAKVQLLTEPAGLSLVANATGRITEPFLLLPPNTLGWHSSRGYSVRSTDSGLAGAIFIHAAWVVTVFLLLFAAVGSRFLALIITVCAVGVVGGIALTILASAHQVIPLGEVDFIPFGMRRTMSLVGVGVGLVLWGTILMGVIQAYRGVHTDSEEDQAGENN